MNKIITAIMCMALLLPMTGAAQEEEHPGGWNFDIMGFNTKMNISYNSHASKVDFIFLNNWGLGFNAALGTPDGMDVEMGRSFHFFIGDLIGWRFKLSKRSSLSLGFGIDLKNFTMTGPTRFEALPTHNVVLTPYPEGASPEHSRMRIFSTTYNFKYQQRMGRHFYLTLGPELYVVRAPGKRHEVRNIYTTADGKEHRDRFKGIYTNKVGLNLVGMLGYRNVGLYVKYTPTHYLSSLHGPQFNSLSTGVVLGL